MLPSTGYFKGIYCPFYDSGLCERPYCHFRHVKKESQTTSSDGIESGAILQKLVSAAVQKVLQQTEVSAAAISSQSSVVDSTAVIDKPVTSQTNSKATYNPTPIAELNKINNTDIENHEELNEQRKRHIPVPYTPRKPASLQISRPAVTNGSSKPFIYIPPPPVKYTPGSGENIQNDKYTPPGTTESKEKYLPGTETERQEYKPYEGNQQIASKRNYVPSDRSVAKKKILEYKPIKVTNVEVSSVTYKPTPKALAPCFSSDEDEPDIKKRNLSSDLNGLDDLGAEFDILDQILDEEKDGGKVAIDKEKIGKSKTSDVLKNSSAKSDKESKKSRKDVDQNKKATVDKIENSKSHKSKSDKKENSRSVEKDEKTEHKIKHSENKYSHKSSSKDEERSDKRSKDKHKDKHSDKKRHSSSKSSNHSYKESRHLSSRKSGSNSESKSSKSKHKKSHKSSKDSKEKHKSKEISSKNVSDDDDDHNNDNLNIDEEVYISESDEETIALECKKIFEEYVPTAKSNIVDSEVKIDETQKEEYIPGKKRISRTVDKNIKIAPRVTVKPDFKLSAAQAMSERLTKVREYHMSKGFQPAISNENIISKLELPKSTFSTPSSGITKIRIAHVPYVSTMINAKKSIVPSKSDIKSEPSTSSTIIQTNKKGSQRVAHVPNEKFIDRPGVLEPLASKIPANIRSTYLNMMIDECLKIYLTATDAYARAQQEELATSKKCSTVQIYKNSAGLTVNRLRKELQECNGVKKLASDYSSVQKTPDNKSISMGSWSIESKNRKVIDHNREFSGSKLYSNISKWILTEDQLKENGFPRSHPSGEKGRAIIYGQNKQKPPRGFIRICCRCKKDYTVDKKGFPVVKEECIYHPNNKYRVRGEVRYQCCSQDGTSDGCCVAPNHVYEYVDFDNLKGYVKTLPPERNMDDYGVYSLDCEMCYTTHGLDLTRVTVIDSACKVVYETLIRPLHPIMDYNTRYSGITEEQMSNVKTTLLEVQATLLSMFNSKTILIGHSLESDFKALKLIHETVIDTSVLFPHKMGPPYKRALRNLSSEHLKKIIQNSVDGHDSAEDATVCMELIHYKIKEDLKTR